jgi:hypothetical protein
MTKQTKTILGVLVVAGVGYYIWSRNKAGKKLNPFASYVGDEFFSNAVGRGARRVVGGYDRANNRTWIYTEGNMGQGYFVSGKVNVPSGTRFN